MMAHIGTQADSRYGRGCRAQQSFIRSLFFAQQRFGSPPRSAEHGFTPSLRSAQQGFTLIELMVSLMIFAMLAAAGVMLLGNSVSAQGAIRDHLDRQGEMARVVALLDQDMAMALPRISRTESGLLAPAFFSRTPSEKEPFLQFVRGGWTNPDEAPRPSVQKVEYWLRDGQLERRGYQQVDGAAGDEPAMLLDKVDGLSLSFRDDQGEWVDQWQPQKPLAMPRAVRMVISRAGQSPVTLLLLVGLGEQPTITQQGEGSGG